MKVKAEGLTPIGVGQIIETVNKKYCADIMFNRPVTIQGNYIVFTLRVRYGGEIFSRIGITGRKMVSLCYHGHREFMRELFNRHPDAVLVSGIARYEGKRDFEISYSLAGDRNSGSRMEPQQYRDLCKCPESIRADY